MNKRIRKKEEKDSLMEYSFEIAPNIPYKKRRKIVDKQWKIYHNAGYRIKIGYKRQSE